MHLTNATSSFAPSLFAGLVLLSGCFVGCKDRSADELQTAASAPVPRPTAEKASLTLADHVAAVERLIQQRQFVAAEQQLRERMIQSPAEPTYHELAGDVAALQNQVDQSVECYSTAIRLHAQPPKTLLDKLGRQWMSAGRPFEALEVLKRLVKLYPDDLAVRADLAGLLMSLALEREAVPHLQYLVQRDRAGVNELIVLTDITRPQTDKAICDFALRTYPADKRPAYALARLLAYDQKWQAAYPLLRDVCDQHPEFIDAWAYLGRALVELNNQAELQRWSQSLPPGIDAHPQYWLAAAIDAERRGQTNAACGAYDRAARLESDDGETWTRFAGVLSLTGHDAAAEVARKRAGQLNALRDHVESFFFWRKHSQRAAINIARSMQQLQRPWEAVSWAKQAALMTQDPDPQAIAVFQDLRSKLTGRTPWRQPIQMDSWSQDSVAEGQPSWFGSGDALATQDAKPSPEGPRAAYRFEDEAAAWGLQHVCKIATPAEGESGLWIYQSGAGGVSVIDFDLDGLPDLYLTNCDGQPRARDSEPNRIYRNLNRRYVEVTAYAGVGDTGFAQGVTSGDYNEDGFPDLYVGNFGQNTLYRNNGDGTFTDVSDECGVRNADHWTTSVAIVDIDEDGLADLYDVNYIAGNEVITTPCIAEKIQSARSCGPLVFAAEPDRVLRAVGDGTFTDVSHAWLKTPTPGRGLGIVAGNFDEIAGMDLLIANDMSANHFWSSRKQADEFQLIEQAVPRGLAFNERSLSQASMGIAADDPDNDGDIDFLLTHFTDDYNTFYSQENKGVWTDRSAAVGLVESTRSMLGYGTQWFDADGDGTLELVVANGHVDDFTHNGHAYRMPMQFFERRTSGQMDRIDPAGLGAAFESPRLGRALALLDANCDGATDLVVTHLFDPVALLVNHCQPNQEKMGDLKMSRRITVTLVATKSSRDSIGGTVTVKTEDEVFMRNLIAGGGYQCNNERSLNIALAAGEELANVSVRWPNGEVTPEANVQTNAHYLWVEGESSPFLIHPFQTSR